MIEAQLIFVCTGAKRALIQQLINSISGNTYGLQVYLIVVNQGERFTFKSNDALLKLKTISTERQMSLSAARNLALRFLFSQQVNAQHIMFPDDDSTYSADFFKGYHKLEENQAYLAKICNAQDGRDYRPYPKANRCGKESLLPWVASVSLLLPYPLVKQVGCFDEKLGVGAKWGSSEDLDYYLRCCQAQEFCFVPQLYTYHPSRFGKYDAMPAQAIRKRFKAYTDGFLAVHFRYRLDNKLRFFAHRALAGALLCLFKLKLGLFRQYLWLYFYRLKAKARFRKMRQHEPEKLAPQHGI